MIESGWLKFEHQVFLGDQVAFQRFAVYVIVIHTNVAVAIFIGAGGTVFSDKALKQDRITAIIVNNDVLRSILVIEINSI